LDGPTKNKQMMGRGKFVHSTAHQITIIPAGLKDKHKNKAKE
jgi:hypothetical protein